MTFNWERKRLDSLSPLFNNQPLPVSNDHSGNILTLKPFPNEVGRAVNLDLPGMVDLSDKGDFSRSHGKAEAAFRVDVATETEVFWQMPKGSPELVPECTREPGAMFLLGNAPMRLLVVVVSHEPLADSLKGGKSRAIVSSGHSFLPETIETLNAGISTWFSFGNEDQMNTEKKVKTHSLGETKGVTSPPCSCHLIVKLGYKGKAHKSPCLEKMPAEGEGLLVGKLTGTSSVPCHIHSVEAVKAGDSLGTPEVPRANNVCLMQISHLLSFEVGIGLIALASLDPCLLGFSMPKEDSCNGRDGGNIFNFPTFKLPLDGFRSDPREGREASLTGNQLFSNAKYLSNHVLRGLSSNLLKGTTLIFESLKTFLFVPAKPFRKPAFAPVNQLQYFCKASSFIVKLYCSKTLFILVLLFHRLLLLPKLFGRSLGRLRISSRCCDNFLVHDVMT